MLKNHKHHSLMASSLFKYLKYVPIYKGCIYSLEGKKKKFKSLDALLMHYYKKFEINKIYKIKIYNPNAKQIYSKDELKKMTTVEAYRALAATAEYRFLSVVNNIISFEWFVDETISTDINVDYEWMYGESNYEMGYEVHSTVEDQNKTLHITHLIIPKFGDEAGLYTKDNIKSCTVEEARGIDLCYLVSDKEGNDYYDAYASTLYLKTYFKEVNNL